MYSDDALKKLVLPLAVVAAVIASSASVRTVEAPGLRAPVVDARTMERWGAAYRAASPLIQFGN